MGESEPVYFFPADSKRQYKGLHGRDSIILVEDAEHHKNPNKGVKTFLQYEKLLHEHGSAYQRTKASARYFGISMPGSSTKKTPEARTICSSQGYSPRHIVIR